MLCGRIFEPADHRRLRMSPLRRKAEAQRGSSDRTLDNPTPGLFSEVPSSPSQLVSGSRVLLGATELSCKARGLGAF